MFWREYPVVLVTNTAPQEPQDRLGVSDSPITGVPSGMEGTITVRVPTSGSGMTFKRTDDMSQALARLVREVYCCQRLPPTASFPHGGRPTCATKGSMPAIAASMACMRSPVTAAT